MGGEPLIVPSERTRSAPLRLFCSTGHPMQRLSCSWCVLQGFTPLGSRAVGCAAPTSTLASRPSPRRVSQWRFSARVNEPKCSPLELAPLLQSARTWCPASPRSSGALPTRSQRFEGCWSLRTPLTRFLSPSALKVAASTPSSTRESIPWSEDQIRSRRYLSRCVPPSPFLRPRRFAPPHGDTRASPSTPTSVSLGGTLGVGCTLQGLPDSRGHHRHRRCLPLLTFPRPVLPSQSLSLVPNQWAFRGLLVQPAPKREPESTVVASVWFPARQDSFPHGLLFVGPLTRRWGPVTYSEL